MSKATKQKSLIFHDSSFDTRSYTNGIISPYYRTDLGALFEGDCLDVLPTIKAGIVDTVFADPPFNLNKKYGDKSDDNKSEEEYITWSYQWLDECVRVLKAGGALFVYNLPKWNILYGAYLMKAGLEFRHDIAVDMRNCLPISGRLYPSHYSLLYFTKGKPNCFRKIRTPIETCRHCDGEIRDYGGHRDAMNPNGVNLKDVWSDIPPVRHKKFQSKTRKANALSTKLLDRVVELSTNKKDLVLDPFGGSGTTFSVCEKKQRRWLGIELDFAQDIVDRLEDPEIEHHNNDDFVED